MKQELSDAIEATMELIKSELTSGVSDASLGSAQRQLMSLAARTELFDSKSFPFPTDTKDRTFLVHDTAGEFALYVCTSEPGLESKPHDHGGSWAVVAAVSGAQSHRFYTACGSRLTQVGEVVCEPGTAVSMLAEGIHSIHAGDEPLVHLHLYGLAFENQKERREFDPATETERRFELTNLTWIEDRR